MSRSTLLMILLINTISCGVCLDQPFHTEDTAFYTPGLLGRWKCEKPEGVWEFTEGEGFSYSLQMGTGSMVQNAHLVRLRDDLFIVIDAPSKNSESDHPVCHFFLLGKIVYRDDSFTFYPLAMKVLEALLREAKGALALDQERESTLSLPVLMGKTEDIQRFFSKHAENIGLFDESMKRTYRRITGSEE